MMRHAFWALALVLTVSCAKESTVGSTPDVAADAFDDVDADDEAKDAADGSDVPPVDGDAAGDPGNEDPLQCAPCTSDDECDGLFCRQVEATRTWHCLKACDAGAAVCGQGSTCSEVDGLMLCTPEAGDCACTSEHTNRSGRCRSVSGCEGTFGCEDDGPVACDAPDAKSEVCNAKDDDCDGAIDEDAHESCDDGSICTVDVCDPEVGCVYTPADGTCLIGLACFTDGQVSPLNACVHCNWLTDSSAWSPVPDGTGCNDGQICTVGDACAAGECQGDSPPDLCDDGNACTTDVCDPAKGCTNVGLDGVGCDDGDACTEGDECQGGGCVGVPMKCDDGIDCTVDVCTDGICSSDALVEDACLIDEVCHAADSSPPNAPCMVCDPGVDESAWVPRPDGTECDDGSDCAIDDACQDGACVTTPADCDDDNECTFDFCFDSGGGLNQGVSGLACDDGDPCSLNDACSGKTCVGGLPAECPDDDPCTVASCEPFVGCVDTPDPTATDCDDGDPCTTDDVCIDGDCAGEQLPCDDGIACTLDVCVDGACESTVAPGNCLIDGGCVFDGTANPNNPCEGCRADVETGAWTSLPPGAPCDDGDACTASELCQGGACVGGTPVSCDDFEECTADSCDSQSGCQYVLTTGPCNDGKFCTVADTCEGGACVGGARDCSALDGDCVEGACDEAAAACVAANRDDGTDCDDGKACSGPDGCLAGQCVGAPIPNCCTLDSDCDDGNPCTVDTCEAGGTCDNDAAALEGQGCEDGAFCTEGDVCTAGACVGQPRVCASDDCNAGFCDEGADTCQLDPATNGAPCPDDGNVCTFDGCVDGVCLHIPNVAPCDDGQACTFNDGCQGGACSGTAYDCNDGHDCTTDTCLGDGFCDNAVAADHCLIGTECIAELTLDSGNPCRRCEPATDTTGWTPLPDGAACPDDGQPCTSDQCQAGSCTHPNNSDPCDDLDDCTSDDVCADGNCAGTTYDCDDSVPCTQDLCDGTGGCDHPITAGFCFISGVCYVDGAKSANECQTCDAGGDPGVWTPVADGTGCDDDNLCTTDDECSGGACIGASVS